MNHTSPRVVALALIAVFTLNSGAEAASQVEVRNGALAEQVDAILAKASASGFRGALVLQTKGRPLLRAGYGTADLAGTAPFTTATVAQIGSVTKAMTAVAILQLAQAGKLDLQARVGAYIPDAAQPAASATLHQLLTHHAGLIDACADDFDALSKADLLHRCMSRPLVHSKTEDGYSNLGFSILAAVVEQVSGEPWEAYMRGHVWGPLGMDNTGFHMRRTPGRVFAAGSLKGVDQGVISDRLDQLGDADWTLRGNGGVQASANDMARLGEVLAGNLPGIPASIRTGMTTPREKIEDRAWEAYGLAVRLDAAGKPARVGLAGSDGVFWSYFGWLPQSNTVFYFVGANGEDDVKRVAGAVIKAIQDAAGAEVAG